MQNTITPIAPTTATPPVESRPSPKSAPSHAFATLLKQSQIQPPAPAQAAPVPPARSDNAGDPDSPVGTTRTDAKATTAATEARRRDDAKSGSEVGDAHHGDEAASASDEAGERGDKDPAGASASSGTNGTGLPFTHGLVTLRRLPAAAPEGAGAGSGRTSTSSASAGDAADAGTGSTAQSTSTDLLGPRATADAARKDEPSSLARTAIGATSEAGTTAKSADAAPLGGAAKAMACMASELSAVSSIPLATAPTPEAATPVPSAPADATVATPLTAPEFAQAFAVQVSVLVQDGVQRAELHLNPAEMGPVSVQIVVDGTQARIDFGADALATRQAIEAGLPELASTLRDAGMTLQGGGVSQHARDPSDGAKPGDGQASARGPWRDDDPRPAPVVRQRTVAAGGLDLYA